MENDNRIYIAIDLKSFYASVECIERGLDPMCAHLSKNLEGFTLKLPLLS